MDGVVPGFSFELVEVVDHGSEGLDEFLALEREALCLLAKEVNDLHELILHLHHLGKDIHLLLRPLLHHSVPHYLIVIIHTILQIDYLIIGHQLLRSVLPDNQYDGDMCGYAYPYLFLLENPILAVGLVLVFTELKGKLP